MRPLAYPPLLLITATLLCAASGSSSPGQATRDPIRQDQRQGQAVFLAPHPGPDPGPDPDPDPDSDSDPDPDPGTDNKPTNVLTLSREWRAIGPFPSGMRELPFGANPAAAFGNLAHVLDGGAGGVPSALSWTPDGSVPLAHFRAEEIHTRQQLEDEEGEGRRRTWSRQAKQRVEIAYPRVDWDRLRSTVGWHALQFQATLVADLTIRADPASASAEADADAEARRRRRRRRRRIAIVLDKGAEFAVVPAAQYSAAAADGRAELHAQWHTGDLYSYNVAPNPLPDELGRSKNEDQEQEQDEGAQQHQEKQKQQQSFLFPHTLLLAPGAYKLLVRAQYENRIFGEPHSAPGNGQRGVPTIALGIEIGVALVDPPLPVSPTGRPRSRTCASSRTTERPSYRTSSVAGLQVSGSACRCRTPMSTAPSSSRRWTCWTLMRR